MICKKLKSFKENGWQKYVCPLLYVLCLRKAHHICDSGVVGNARPCQGRDRGFEPRLSLNKTKKKYCECSTSFFVLEAERSYSPTVRVRISAPLRSGQSRGPLDLVAPVYRLIKRRTHHKCDGFFSVAMHPKEAAGGRFCRWRDIGATPQGCVFTS